MFRTIVGIVGIVTLGVSTAVTFAATSTPEPEPQKSASSSLRKPVPGLDDSVVEETARKRTKLREEAIAAVSATENALKALEEEKIDDALESLEKVIGKLELIVARDPELSLAPVEVQIVTYDLLPDPEAIQDAITQSTEYLQEGEVQKARPVVANLASEIAIRTTHIPLATYPDAIKKIAPLIDAGEIDRAKTALQLALNTLVVTTDNVIPLPMLRAEDMLKQAEALAGKENRSEEENQTLEELLSQTREQLKMAQLLGYGEDDSYGSMYEQLDKIEQKTAGGGSGEGFFDRLKRQVSELL